MNPISKAKREFQKSLIIMAVFSLATNLLLLSIPLYMLQIYDRVLPSRSDDTLIFLTLIAVLALFALGLLEVVRTIVANRVAARLDTSLGDLAIRSIIRVGASTGGNTQPYKDVASLRGLLSSKIAFVLLDLPFASIFIAILYMIHPDLFWITLAGAGVLLILAFGNQIATHRANLNHNTLSVVSNQNVEHLARNSDSLIAMGMVNDAILHWGSNRGKSLQSADAATNINAWFAGFSRILRMGLQLAILGYGAKLVLAGEMTAGMIFASSIISGRGLQPIDQTIGSWTQLASGWQAWARTKVFLENTHEETERTKLPTPIGKLEVKELHQPNLSDPGKPAILQHVSFQLEPGESVAIIGSSGSGKTTLARMLVGAIKSRIGQVNIDGNDIWNWDREALGKHVGYLPQDVELLPGTISENISRFDSSAHDEEIIAAARLAHVEVLIQSLPKGYDTVVGPGGTQLSGGEKQRIALARALFGQPKLLVLDEPNSNLDMEGNQALSDALADAKKNLVTVVLVTQREAVLNAVDKILHIENGAIREFGDRLEILNKLRIQRAGGEKKTAASAQSNNVISSKFVHQMRAKAEQTS